MEHLRELRKRYDEAKNYKDRWLALYKELYAYVIPNRDAFNVKFGYDDNGKPATYEIWDNTASLAAYQRANDLHGLLMPQDRVWGKLVVDPHRFDKDFIKNSKEMIDEVNDNIFFYLNQSNLSRAVASSNLDLVGGTAAIWVESVSDLEPLYFRSIPAVALYLEYSTDDVINNCWYNCKMSARQVLDDFPKYRGRSYDMLKENEEEITQVIYGQVKQKENHFYIYAVLESDPLTPLFEVERTYPQIIVYRDRVRPGEAEGRGIGIDLLPTIKDLNRIVMYSRQSLAFKANPPIFYDATSYWNPHSVRQWAGAMIGRNPQQRNPLEAMQMPEAPEVYQHILHLQEVIQKGFQVDPLGEIQTPVRSATEVSIRENRAQRTSATDISRLINELPKQIFEVSAKILNERNLLTRKRDRDQLKGFSTKKLTFDFQSPLYDLQKQQELNAFVNNLQIKQQFFGEGAAMASVDLVEANNFLTDKLNLPRKLFASDQQLQAYLQQMAQQLQQAQQPQPQASASQVQLPTKPGITI